MGAFNTVGLEAVIESFSKREQATVSAVPKMLKAGADVLVEAQRAEARAMGIVETAGFVNSIKATAVKGERTVETAVLGVGYIGNSYLANTF